MRVLGCGSAGGGVGTQICGEPLCTEPAPPTAAAAAPAGRPGPPGARCAFYVLHGHAFIAIRLLLAFTPAVAHAAKISLGAAVMLPLSLQMMQKGPSFFTRTVFFSKLPLLRGKWCQKMVQNDTHRAMRERGVLDAQSAVGGHTPVGWFHG